MKFNISVEVDWLDEDGNIDDQIKDELVSGIKKQISKDCLKRVESDASKAIDDAIKIATQSINDRVLSFVNDWLENEVEITDKWGEPGSKSTLKDIIKQRFDNTLEQNVDKNGRFSSSSYDSQKLIFWLTESKVKEQVSEYLKGYNKEMDSKIKALVEDGIKSRVSDKFAEMVIGYAKRDAAEAKAIRHDS